MKQENKEECDGLNCSGSNATPTVSSDHSHIHCWNQNNPACGQKLEDHKQCCLCSATPPETSSWEEEFEKKFIFAVKYKSGESEIVDFDYHKKEVEKLKDFIRSVASSEYKRGVEDRKKEIIELIKARALDCPMRSLIINLISTYD